PFRDWGTLGKFGRSQLAARFTTPDVPVRSRSLKAAAHELAKRVREFGREVQRLLFHLRKLAWKEHNGSGPADEELLIARQLLQRQYLEERIADAACDLYASGCTLSRLDHLLAGADG